MIDLPVADPGGIGVVTKWIQGMHEGGSPRSLWVALDDRLRLALAQGWVLHVRGGPDDDFAEDLADEDTDNPDFLPMIDQFVARWRQVYSALQGEIIGVYERSILVGLDMELLILTGPEYIGTVRSRREKVPGHCFIIRYENESWRIAALARRLPVPGWPPAEQDVSAFAVVDDAGAE